MAHAPARRRDAGRRDARGRARRRDRAARAAARPARARGRAAAARSTTPTCAAGSARRASAASVERFSAERDDARMLELYDEVAAMRRHRCDHDLQPRARILPGALESVFAQTRAAGRGARRRRRLDRRHARRARRATATASASCGRRTPGARARGTPRSARRAAGSLSFLDSDDRWTAEQARARGAGARGGRRTSAIVHGHVDVIGADGAVLADETARHHELFSAAHRNGVTYAGYAFDCRCFSSAITAPRRRGRDGRALRHRRCCSTTTTSTCGSRSTARSSSSRGRRWRSTATTRGR